MFVPFLHRADKNLCFFFVFFIIHAFVYQWMYVHFILFLISENFRSTLFTILFPFLEDGNVQSWKNGDFFNGFLAFVHMHEL